MRQRLRPRIRIRHYIERDPEISTVILNFLMAPRPRFSGDSDKRFSVEILGESVGFTASL